MSDRYKKCESIYWVFTQLCNDECSHCYNNSGPLGKRLSEEECMNIIDNLPLELGRIILSGGEPLSEMKLLLKILYKLKEKYNCATEVMLQTNGDLLNGEKLDQLIDAGVTRFDIASIDDYHKYRGQKLLNLRELFDSRQVNGDDIDPLIQKENFLTNRKLSWGYWGSTKDMWLGGNWARGRSLCSNIWKRDSSHNFCKILSGARNFLGGNEDIPQEISIQLWKVQPCCPGTLYPLGDARKEKISDILSKSAKIKDFQALNRGEPLEMGDTSIQAMLEKKEILDKLENICLYCDAYFAKNFGHLKIIE